MVKDEDKPLTEKLEALVSRFNDFSTINFQYSDFSNAKINLLEPLNQQNIYMIIQEIMTNIIKHSKATEDYIQIFENKKNMTITIEDDGIGIENSDENKGIGLKNIGIIKILSQTKNGTQMTLINKFNADFRRLSVQICVGTSALSAFQKLATVSL